MILGVSPGLVRLLARTGELPGLRMGEHHRFHLSTLERYRDGAPRRPAVGRPPSCPRPRQERVERPSPAEVVRGSLERARRDGLGFDAAWEAALAGIPRGR